MSSIFTKSDKPEKDPERVTKWFAARPPKSEKDGEVELKRLSVEKVHYLFLAAWFIISFFVGRAIMLFYTPDPLTTYSLNRFVVIGLAAACICFVFFSLLAAKQHSKQFNTNILSVFEYMLRQDKTLFSYRKRGMPEYETEGKHKLHLVLDDADRIPTAEEKNKGVDEQIDNHGGSDVIIRLTKVASLTSAENNKEFSERISNIEEVTIGNQNESVSSPEYIQKNNKIRQMMLSDRSQLIAFVSMYVFAMLAGALLGYGL